LIHTAKFFLLVAVKLSTLRFNILTHIEQQSLVLEFDVELSQKKNLM